MPNTKPPPFGEYLTITGAAKALRVSRQAITEAINRGRIESTSVGHVRLISKTALDTYKKTRHAGGQPKLSMDFTTTQ